MADLEEQQLPESDLAGPRTKWGPVIVALVFLGMGVLAFWAIHEKKSEKERGAQAASLDKELDTDEAAVKAQREKVESLTRQVEELRNRIQYGDVKDGKAAVAEFNALAAQQRA